MDLLTHIVQTALPDLDHDDLSRRRCILQLDFANMFNSVSRHATRQELLQHFPHFVHVFDQLYPPHGNNVRYRRANGSWVSLTQQEGFAQGSPLSPFFSCLPLHRLLCHTQRHLDQRPRLHNADPGSSMVAYMDDTTGLSNISDVGFIFHHLATHGPPLRLHLSDRKCKILASTAGIHPNALLQTPLQNDIHAVTNRYFQVQLSHFLLCFF